MSNKLSTKPGQVQLLRFLEWFGLVEGRVVNRDACEYRKNDLFDRILYFDVEIPSIERLLH